MLAYGGAVSGTLLEKGRTMLIRTLAGLITAAVVTIPTPAAADAPSIYYPLYRSDGVEVTTETVYIDAGAGMWSARQSARRWESLVPTLNIEIGPCVSSAPCIRVHVGKFDHIKTKGAWCDFPSHYERDLYLNTQADLPRGGRKLAVMHEMGHALGLDHHDRSRGVMSSRVWDNPYSLTPSRGEIRVLTEQFAS